MIYGVYEFNFLIMLLGRIICGVGAGPINTLVCVIVGKFFKGKESSFSLAILFTCSNVGLALCSYVTPIIYSKT